MQHRHLDVKPDYRNFEVIESIFERGSDKDQIDLISEAYRDPFGPVSELILQVVSQNKYYGWSKGLPEIINIWRNGANHG